MTLELPRGYRLILYPSLDASGTRKMALQAPISTELLGRPVLGPNRLFCAILGANLATSGR